MTEWACTSNAQDPTYVVTYDGQFRVHGAAAIKVRLAVAEIKTAQFFNTLNIKTTCKNSQGVGRNS
jgi:hypothetical protein